MNEASIYGIRVATKNLDVLGQVYLSCAGIKEDIGHGIGRMEAITSGAVPAVIDHGKVVDYQKDRKGCGWGGAVIGENTH